MRLVSTRKMTNDVAKHNNNANEALSTRAMTNDVAMHINNANEAAKQDNDDKRGC